VQKKDLPEVSGGDGVPGIGNSPITPYYPVPVEYPRQPFAPVCEMPTNDPIE
jgi:hypothetical protein